VATERIAVSDCPATPILVVDPDLPDPAALDAAAQVLLGGGLVAFATETVYGLGAIATMPPAVARIFAAKGRPGKNPLIVHVAGIARARDCVSQWPDQAECLARRFWPGPLTLVLRRAPAIPDLVTAGRETVAVRAPAGKVAAGLIERVGQPIAAPSANRSSRLSPTRAEHVLADLGGFIDLIIDSGRTSVGLESTVLDLSVAPSRLLRPGPISKTELERALGGRRIDEIAPGESPESPSSPGQMPVHYAPRTPAFRVDSPRELEGRLPGDQFTLVYFGEPADPVPGPAGRFILETPEEASRLFYDVLHQCDSFGLGAIVVVMPRPAPEWQAVRDRLLRATRPLPERG
jgi:L-threonylcarbamoyladenylate synthase